MDKLILFLLKKSFFSLWDNLFKIIFFNLGFMVLLGASLLLLALRVSIPPVFFIFIQCILILAFFLYSGGVFHFLKEICEYNNPKLAVFFLNLKGSCRSSLVPGALSVLYFTILRYSLPFYLNLDNILGFTAFFILIGISILFLLTCQYFFPLAGRQDKRFFDIFRNGFFLFLDNPLFTFFMSLGSVIISIFSFFTALLLPGLTAVFLWHQTGFGLLLLKYRYLELNPGSDRRSIPWEILLEEERTLLGKRSFKGLIFPWKD